jgi:N-methylhydantoinase A/oxoprolinase/acetone carboxylase beta subunit
MLAIMEASNKDAQGLASGDCAGVYGARHVGREADGNLGDPPPSAPARAW